MRFRQTNKSICFLLILCILLLGMYPGKNRVDSFFSSANSNTSPVYTITNTTITSPGSNVVPKQTYTRETIIQYETLLLPQQTLRRTPLRSLFKGVHFFSTEIAGSLYISKPFKVFSHRIPDGFINTAIIMTYIHNQDGEKA